MLSLGVSDLGPQHKEEQMSSKQIKKYQVLVYKETHYGWNNDYQKKEENK